MLICTCASSQQDINVISSLDDCICIWTKESKKRKMGSFNENYFLMFKYNKIIALCKYLIIKNIKSQSEIEM